MKCSLAIQFLSTAFTATAVSSSSASVAEELARKYDNHRDINAAAAAAATSRAEVPSRNLFAFGDPIDTASSKSSKSASAVASKSKSKASFVDDCVTTAPTATAKSGKGSKALSFPTGKSGKTDPSESEPERRRMDSLRGVYGSSELGPKKAFLMELRMGSAKYSGGGGEEDIMERNLVRAHTTLVHVCPCIISLHCALLKRCVSATFNFRRVQNLGSHLPLPENRLSPLIHQIAKVVEEAKDLSVSQLPHPQP